MRQTPPHSFSLILDQSEHAQLLAKAKELRSLRDYDDAIVVADKLIASLKGGESSLILGEAYETLKYIYCETKQLDKALEYAEKALETFQKMENKSKISDNLHDIAFIMAG